MIEGRALELRTSREAGIQGKLSRDSGVARAAPSWVLLVARPHPVG